MLFNKYFLTLLLLLSSIFFTHQVPYEKTPTFSANEVQDSTEVTFVDTLQQYAQKANSLWEEQQSNLTLANKLLSSTAKNKYETYYRLASSFYFWSIQNASFEEEKQAVKKEVERLLPLVSDSTKTTWQTYLENEDPQLLREIIGFWRTQDPYSSTQLNERLLEHWRRINVAQSNFNKSDNPPYGTDDRGNIYVKYGPPDKRSQTTLNFSYIIDPISGQKLSFELGNLIYSEVEIWEYNNEYEGFFFLFGPEHGTGEFGLRNNAMELVNTTSISVSFENSYWLPQYTIQTISENALKFGIYKRLAPYHPFFQEIFNRIKSRLRGTDESASVIQRYQQNTGDVENLVYHKLYRQQVTAPNNRTSLKSESADLSVLTKTYRFLNDKNQNEYLFSIKPTSEAITDTLESQFLSNKLYVFDKKWNTLSKIDDLKNVDTDANNTFTYQISQSAVQNNVFFSSELIDTTRNDIYIPGRINSKTSAIVKSTGKEKVSFTNPLPVNEKLLISDVVVGKQQERNSNARLPITPSLDMTFHPDSDVMIYFETYNVPGGGYSFTYYFKRKRWLGNPKKLEDKSEVTILAEQADKRDSQLFSINLDDLEPQAYQLVIEFTPLESSSITKRKQIDFEIIE